MIVGSQLGSFGADIEDIGADDSSGAMGDLDPAQTNAGKG